MLVYTGATVNLECAGNSIWKKDEIVLQTTLKSNISFPGKYITVLTIVDVKQEDTGIYICNGKEIIKRRFSKNKFITFIQPAYLFVASKSCKLLLEECKHKLKLKMQLLLEKFTHCLKYAIVEGIFVISYVL